LGYRAGFNINWTLYDAGAASAQARQFDAERAVAESRFTQFADQVRLDVVRAYNTLRASREQIPAATLALEQAREALDLSQARLSAGISTELELIQNEDAFTQAEVNRLTAIINFNQAIVQLKRAISGL
jgi:OMF family outer membrane factor